MCTKPPPGYYNNIMRVRVNIFPPKCRFRNDRQQVVTRQFVRAIIIIIILMSCVYIYRYRRYTYITIIFLHWTLLLYTVCILSYIILHSHVHIIKYYFYTTSDALIQTFRKETYLYIILLLCTINYNHVIAHRIGLKFK